MTDLSRNGTEGLSSQKNQQIIPNITVQKSAANTVD